MRAFALVLLAATFLTGADTKKTQPKLNDSRTLTGCIDQRGEDFVLTGDRELRKLATLKPPAGVTSYNMFARFMGHKVSVKGKVVTEGESASVQVTDIKRISDTCAPDDEK